MYFKAVTLYRNIVIFIQLILHLQCFNENFTHRWFFADRNTCKSSN